MGRQIDRHGRTDSQTKVRKREKDLTEHFLLGIVFESLRIWRKKLLAFLEGEGEKEKQVSSG